MKPCKNCNGEGRVPITMSCPECVYKGSANGPTEWEALQRLFHWCKENIEIRSRASRSMESYVNDVLWAQGKESVKPGSRYGQKQKPY